MTLRPRTEPSDSRVGLGLRFRWNAAYLTYRWAKRRLLRVAQELGAVEVERETVLRELARPRSMTEVHVVGAACRLQPIPRA